MDGSERIGQILRSMLVGPLFHWPSCDHDGRVGPPRMSFFGMGEVDANGLWQAVASALRVDDTASYLHRQQPERIELAPLLQHSQPAET